MRIKSTKWYGRFWPPEQRKIKLMQALLDHYEPEIQKKFQERLKNHLLYGTPIEEVEYEWSPTDSQTNTQLKSELVPPEAEGEPKA